MMKTGEVKRGAAFGLLSFLFLYPRDETLDFLASGGLGALEELAGGLGIGALEALGDFRRRLEAGEAERAGLLLDLQRDYTRLFINAYPRMVAPPYSSVYMDGKGKVWGESTSWVYNLYREAGLEISEDFHNLPDHIAAELSFAAFLLSGEEEGRAANTAMYERLISEHLAHWAEPFLQRVMRGAREPFYALLAKITLFLVEEENRRLREG
ncbi:MAG: TorD/DmsD family molecular chaperone [Actinomycetota bacterium]